MNIDTSKMRRTWWEDAEGNVLELKADRMPTEKEMEQYRYYHSEFPCKLSHEFA